MQPSETVSVCVVAKMEHNPSVQNFGSLSITVAPFPRKGAVSENTLIQLMVNRLFTSQFFP